jgi:hypothetical protein
VTHVSSEFNDDIYSSILLYVVASLLFGPSPPPNPPSPCSVELGVYGNVVSSKKLFKCIYFT